MLLGLGVLFLLRAWATFFPTSWLWGLDTLAERGLAWRFFGFLLLALAFWRPAALAVGGVLGRTAELSWPGRLVLSLVSAVPLYLARDLNLLLGDTQLNVRALSKKLELSGTAEREPGAVTIVSWFHHHIGAAMHADSGISYALVSVAFGVLYVFLAMTLARRLGRNRDERAVILTGAVALGSMQVFFGYPENYFFVNALGVLYLVLALRWLDGRGSLAVPAAVLGFATFVHSMCGFLVPSFVYLLWIAFRKRRRLETALAAFAALAGLLLPLIAIRYPLPELLRVSRSDDPFLPPLSKGVRSPAYNLFSWVHVTELLNESMLAAPLLLALGLGLAVRHRRTGPAGASEKRRVLAVAAAGLVSFAIIANPILGMSRDWDVLTFTFTVVSIFAAVQLVAAPVPPRTLRWIAGALAITGFVHLGLWVTHNRTPQATRMRFHRIAANERLFGKTWNAELWRYLGSMHAQSGELALAKDSYVRAIKRNPVEPMTYRLLAEVAYAVGGWNASQAHKRPGPYFREALDEYYRTVLPIASKPSLAYLGAAYAGVQVAGAESLVVDGFKKAVETDPEDLEAGAAWGDVLRNRGRFDEAEAEYKRVLEKQPNQVRALMGLVLLAGVHEEPRDEITARVRELREKFPWSTCVQHMMNLLWTPGGLNTPRDFRGFLCFK